MKVDLKRLDSSGLMLSVFVVLAISFVLMAGTFFVVARDAGNDEQYLKQVTNLRLGAQQVTQHSLRAANGISDGFSKVDQTRKAFQDSLSLIENGNPHTWMPGTPQEVNAFVEKLNQTWKKSDSLINDLLKNREVVVALYERYDELSNVTKDLESNTEAMIKALESINPTPAQMLVATRQLMFLERIGNNVRRSFGGDKTAMDAEQQLGDDVAAFSEALEALRSGDQALNLPPLNHPSVQQTIDNLLSQFQEKMQSIEGFFDVSEQLFSTKDSANDLIQLTPLLLDNIEQLYNGYIVAANQRLISPMLGGVFGAIVLISLALLSVMVIQSTKARAAETKRHLEESERFNRRNQEAILRLLNEISTLADGDLTINATVTEDFTGAIADALNFSIESLRDLVVSINSTAAQITESAQRSRTVATQLTDASERQAQQISKAGQAIIGMANSVKKVSANAVESADVAKKSVEIAGKGAKTVQATISGMDTIREQIQETSKRIKRLGESVQEIGEIVSLIDDIADQTNILALNAAIQAAMAGEAGRGFAVVADEVQRLAERASNATKQIDALVKTIQSDTHEAIGSMEQSTANVVSGAKLAESAGEALVEIETVSVKLAAQIENISQTSRTQAAVASNISGTMTIIQEITTQTSQGTNETAAAIAKLAEQANELKTSVSGFKLPDDRQQAVDEMYAF
jgi:twitching motility protein PilJ